MKIEIPLGDIFDIDGWVREMREEIAKKEKREKENDV
jgi:hypothetical protein